MNPSWYGSKSTMYSDDPPAHGDGYKYQEEIPQTSSKLDPCYDCKPTPPVNYPLREYSPAPSPRSPRAHSCSSSNSGSSKIRSDISYASSPFGIKEPSFMDAFRVLFLTSKSDKKGDKFLATQKRQDRVQDFLKHDRLGSKKWLFYPRLKSYSVEKIPSQNISDQRIKIDGDFFRKYKKRKSDPNAPVAKLKRWELIMYKKLGFIQAIDKNN